MRKRVKAEYWLLFLLLRLAAGATYLRFKVPECQYDQNNQSAYDAALKCAEGGLAAVLSLFEYWDSERTIALFTVFLFVATCLLWTSTHDLVRGAEETAERQLRAYTSASSRDGMPSLTVGTNQAMGVVLTNFGQTPAHAVRYWGDLIIREYPLTSPLSSLPLPKGTFPINPGVRRPVVWETINPLAAEEETEIRAGTQRFYLHGFVQYFDIFNTRRTTTFRYMYGGERLIRMGTGEICEEGNMQT